jgi:hypothetical protein
VREQAGHALIGARQWIPAEHLSDPVKPQDMGLPPGLAFGTKGQLAVDILTEALADGIRLDFVCGDEVYGSCTQLRAFLEARGQAYVLRVPSNFHLTLARGVRLTCKQAAVQLLASDRHWEVRSVGKGSKGARWYAWSWTATISPRHYLLIRRHLITGELAYCYCHVPEGQALSLSRLIRAAGLRWPAEERAASGLTSLRSASTPLSPGAPCWSWQPWPSAPSPPRGSAAAPIPAPQCHPGPTSRRLPTPG